MSRKCHRQGTVVTVSVPVQTDKETARRVSAAVERSTRKSRFSEILNRAQAAALSEAESRLENFTDEEIHALADRLAVEMRRYFGKKS